MKDTLRKYLSKYENKIDLEHLEKVREESMKVFEFEPVDEIPYVLSPWGDVKEINGKELDADWPVFPRVEWNTDPAKMLMSQLRRPYLHNQIKDYMLPDIRADYSPSIIATIMGSGYEMTDDGLPWSSHLEDRDEVQKVIDRGIPDPDTGLGKDCRETTRYYMEVLSDYPKLKKAVHIYHPDLQGPFDGTHLVWGNDIFLAMYDCPDTVKALLQLVTDTYIKWLKEWKEMTGEGNDYTTHWGMFMKGGTCVRNDTPVMITPDQYEEFVRPYDQQILDEFGGTIHFCGNGGVFLKSMCENSRNLYGINMSQPHLNNSGEFIEYTQSNRIVLWGLDEKYIPAGVKTGVIAVRNA